MYGLLQQILYLRKIYRTYTNYLIGIVAAPYSQNFNRVDVNCSFHANDGNLDIPNHL